MKKYDFLSLDWEPTTEETKFKPGMVVETRLGHQYILGELIPDVDQRSAAGAGCGCCSCDYDSEITKFHIVKWAWLCEDLC